MSQIGWISETGEDVLFDDAIAIATQEGSWSDVPLEVLTLIRKQLNKERPDGISVTQLLGCPRSVYLQKTNDYFVRPLDNWPALRGTLIHSLLEGEAPEGATVEERVYRTHRGVEISGQPDSVRVVSEAGNRKLLRDWKSTAKLPMYSNAYLSHQTQASIYRWLLSLDPRMTDIEIVYISLEGVKPIPLKHGGTNRYGRPVASQIMTDEEVEAYLDRRLMVLNAQNEAQKPVTYENVDEEDLWQCDYCPVKRLCYQLAGDEAKAAFDAGRSVKRVPPRKRKVR